MQSIHYQYNNAIAGTVIYVGKGVFTSVGWSADCTQHFSVGDTVTAPLPAINSFPPSAV